MEAIKKFWPYLAIAVLSFLFLRQCNRNADQDKQSESVREFLNHSISYYQNELGQQIAEKQALQGDKAALNVLLSKQIDSTGQLKALVRKFRTVQAAGNITQATRIDTVEISYEVPVPIDFSRDFAANTEYYSITGRVYQNGLDIQTLSIPNTISFALGDKKTGWFKSEYRFEAVNSNPFVKTEGLDGYTLEVPAKRLGISFYAGYGLSSDFTFQTQIGVGVSYTFLRF